MKIPITILTVEQLKELKIFKNRGIDAVISDYAICCGGYIFSFCLGAEKLENRAGWYWTRTNVRSNQFAIHHSSFDCCYTVRQRNAGIRPALPFAFFSSIGSNKNRAVDDILEVEYGEYPQKAASKQLQRKLESLYKRKRPSKTGKKYTRDSVKYDQYDDKFRAEPQEEYEYNGKKYVRVRVNSCYDGKKFTLSNGEDYQDGDYVWIEVSPIKWLVDGRNNIAVTEKLLFSGIQFNNKRDYKGDFENTDLYWYLNTYFVKEIQSLLTYKKGDIVAQKEKSVYQKPVDEIQKQLVELMQFMPDNLKIKMQDKYNSIIDEYSQNRKKEKESIFHGQLTLGVQDSATTLLNKLVFLQEEILTNNEAILNLQKISGYRELLTSTSQEKTEGKIEELIQNIKMEMQNTYIIYKKFIQDKVENIFCVAEEKCQILLESVFENDNSLFHSLNSNPMDQLEEELSQLLGLLRNSNLLKLVEIQNAFSQESTDMNISSLSDNMKTINYVVKTNSNDFAKEKWDHLKQQYSDSFTSLFSDFLEKKDEQNIKMSFDNLRKDLLSYVNWVMTFADVDNYRLKKTEELLNAEKIYTYYEEKDEIKSSVSSLLTEEINGIKYTIEDSNQVSFLDTAYYIQIGKTLDQLKLASDKEKIDQIMQQFYKELTDIWSKAYFVLNYQKSEIVVKKM